MRVSVCLIIKGEVMNGKAQEGVGEGYRVTYTDTELYEPELDCKFNFKSSPCFLYDLNSL